MQKVHFNISIPMVRKVQLCGYARVEIQSSVTSIKRIILFPVQPRYSKKYLLES